MNDCGCDEEFRYEITKDRNPFEGNGIHLYPGCEERAWSQLVAVHDFSLGIDSSGFLYAWGKNPNGRFGNGTYEDSDTPVRVGSDTWKFVTTDGHAVFGIKSDGTLWAWGENTGDGSLGCGKRDVAQAFRVTSAVYAVPKGNFDLSESNDVRATISSSVEEVVVGEGRPRSTWPTGRPRAFEFSSATENYIGVSTRTPRAFWKLNFFQGEFATPGPYGYMRPPLLEVVTLDENGVASGSGVGSGAEVVAIFDGEVVGLPSEGNRWSPLGMMPAVTSGGSGYVSEPEVVFTGGGGNGARARAIVQSGSVTGIELIDGGGGYQSPPAVSFTGGGGSGAAATVHIMGAVYGATVTSGGGGYSSSLHVPEAVTAYSDGVFGNCGESRRMVVVRVSSRHQDDDFVSRHTQAYPSENAFRERLSPPFIGVCRLSPSSVQSIDILAGFDNYAPGLLVLRPEHMSVTNSVTIKARVANADGFGATASAIVSNERPADQGYRGRVLPQLTSGGEGYRAEPRVIVGERSTPMLINSGTDWEEVAIPHQRVYARVSLQAIARRGDKSIWIWGFNPSGYIDDFGGRVFFSESVYSPTPLGRFVRLVGRQNIPTQYKSLWGYESAPVVTESDWNNGAGVSFSVPNPLGGVFISQIGTTTADTGPISAQLYGPADAVRVYAGKGGRYVIDSGGVLWKISDFLGSTRVAGGATTGLVLKTVETTTYGVSIGASSGDASSDEKTGRTWSCPQPPNTNGSTTTTTTSTSPYNPAIAYKVFGGSSAKAVQPNDRWAAIVSGTTKQIATRTESSSEQVWQSTCDITYPPEYQGTSRPATGPITQQRGVSRRIEEVSTYTGPLSSIALQQFMGGLYRYSGIGAVGEGLSFSFNASLFGVTVSGVSFEAFYPSVKYDIVGAACTQCGGRWRDYDPEFKIGIAANGSLKFEPFFEGIDDEFFSGFPFPSSSSSGGGTVGQVTETIPGVRPTVGPITETIGGGTQITAPWSVDYPLSGGGSCPSGTTQVMKPLNIGGFEFGDPVPHCVGTACPPGYTLQGGVCVKQGSCPTGYTDNMQGGCVRLTCPPGYTLQGNVCVGPVTCPADFTAQGESCVRTACPPGYTLRGDQCVRLPTDFTADITKLLPGGIAVDGGGRLWRLPRSPFLYFSPITPVWHSNSALGRPHARLAAFSATVSNESLGVVSPPDFTTEMPQTWSGAKASVTFDGKLYAVGVIDGGSGYASPPSLTIDSGGGGSGGQAVAVIQGPLASLSLENGGSDYSSPPDVAFSDPGIPAKAKCSISGSLSEVVVTSGGQGYLSAPEVLVEGDGTGAVVTATISGGGKVNEVSVVLGGSGYTSSPDVVFVGGGPDASGAAATAVVDDNGVVTEIQITSRGTNYTSAPEVRITGGEGNGCRAVATIASDGFVSSLTIASGGSGYSSPPKIRIVGGGGQGASAVSRISGPVDSVWLTNGGKYRQPPTFSFSVKKEVTSISVSDYGSGYETPPSVLVVGGSGSGATAFAALETTLQNAAVSVTSGGTGYTSAPKVKIIGGGGAFARATSQVSGGVVTGVTITEYGSGFTSAPKVEFIGGGGTGAAASIRLPLGSLVLADKGGGYVSPPLVLFFGGGGTNAAATANIGDRPGSGGGGTGQINGSVIFARVTQEGSNYQRHPIVTASLPDFPEGRQASLQAKIVGTVTGVTVDDGGADYVNKNVVIGFTEGSSRAVDSSMTLRGGTGGDTDVFYANALSGEWLYAVEFGARPPAVVTGQIGPVAPSQPAITEIGNHGYANQPPSRAYFHSKPKVCFRDSIVVNPVVEMQLASFAIGKDCVDNLVVPYSLRYITVSGIGDSGLESSAQTLCGLVYSTHVTTSDSLLINWKGLFYGHKYSTPPEVRVVDASGSGLSCSLSLDADGFVVEEFPDNWGTSLNSGNPEMPKLTVASGSTSPYTSTLGFVISGGTPRISIPSATCTIDSSGRLSSVTLNAEGGGFSTPPLVYVTGGGGVGGAVSFEMIDEHPSSPSRNTKKILSIAVSSAGSGYTSTPQIVFVPQEPSHPGGVSLDELEKMLVYGGDEDIIAGGGFSRTVRGSWGATGRYRFKNPGSHSPYYKEQKIERIIPIGQHYPSTAFGRDLSFFSTTRRAGVGNVCTQFDPVTNTPEWAIDVFGRGSPPPWRPFAVPFFSGGYVAGSHISSGPETWLRIGGHVPVPSVQNGSAGVAAVSLSNSGEGYTLPPAVRFSGGGGAGASAVAQVDSNGRVARIDLTCAGWGYTSQPTVTFSGGGGSGASATAVLAGLPSISVSEVLHGQVASGTQHILWEKDNRPGLTDGEYPWRVLSPG